MDLGKGIPLSFHNLWVVLLVLAVALWFSQIVYRIVKAECLLWRMYRQPGTLFLERMSLGDKALNSLLNVPYIMTFPIPFI